MVEFKNIVKSFPDIEKPILDSVNLRIEESKILTVIGRNGEGKSTLSKIIAGFVYFDSGDVFINNNRQQNWNVDVAKSNGIYIVSQIPKLDMNLRVWEYLSIYWFDSKFFMPMNKSKTYRYYRWLRQFYNITFDLEARIQNLNIKEIYFLLIISSLKKNAKIIIFDESVAYFSQKEAKDFIKLLQYLKIAGITSLFVTHRDVGDAIRFSDEFIILKDGKCFRTINKEIILSKIEIPADKFIAASIRRGELNEDFIKFNLFFEDFWKYDISFSLKKRGVFGIIAEDAAIKTWEKLFLGKIPFVGCIKMNGRRYERINIYEMKAGLLPLGIGNLFSDNATILDSFLAKIMSFENEVFIKRSTINKLKKFFKQDMEYCDSKILKTFYSKSFAFSGGILKKLALFREKYITKSFLICFSPLSNLDYRAYIETSNFIRNFSNEKPVLLITPNLDELLLLADDVLAIKAGEVILRLERGHIDKAALKEMLFI
ncbi:Galactose/methyl galactoside import ATP-binding protein MglA [Borrelia miyamotoi]|uniref:ATP-binding cassette domain-containing protein n=1 Tax=Borrelia miyamotoi TaxID=47466 RepID=A0AAP8YU12_9SPIR|nr:ATP-binding cassette domain-containing protein [Borrelia miyamotoi]AHH05093.1 Nucleoside transport ATP-binding protein [Borrelia miyamotoi FR64b]ATQ14888.1 ATP-binding cassette domain-containing protein [Borrelia miyamotoi]ATQ16070.1 ATP-binding cassette domain-containing protein [Borrelia miyamotoi]ATQ17216.1 ATP-binding cassette domain-containing protein [Borrelia miyamotoi]ATQ18278.1 ATP-binding cassette domain-containing protein [Borrelia miyamotoi]